MGSKGAAAAQARLRAATAATATPVHALVAVWQHRYHIDSGSQRRIARHLGVEQDARPLRGSGGASDGEPARRQEGLPQAGQEAASRRQQERSEGGGEVCRAQCGARNSWRRAEAQGLRSRRDRCRGQTAVSWLRRCHPGGGFEGFETFTWGRRTRRSGGGFSVSTTSSRACSARTRRPPSGCPVRGFRPARPRPGRGRQITITLAEAAKGHARVHLANGKEVESKSRQVSRTASRSGSRARRCRSRRRSGRRRADHGQYRPAPLSQARRREPARRSADHAL